MPLVGGTTFENQDSTDNRIDGIGFNLRGNTLYVGGSGPGNYSIIQNAIDNASNGDTVFVFDDSSPYYENVVVDKSINLIGENKKTTIIDGNGIGDIVNVSADWVNVSGFTIQNGGDCRGSDDRDAGIDIKSNHTIVCDIIILDNAAGIILFSTHSNTISCNSIWSNDSNCILLFHSNNNVISDNNVTKTDPSSIYGTDGVYLVSSNNNTISGNTVSSFKHSIGICIISSSYNTISGNTILENGAGVHLLDSSKNEILSNTIYESDIDFKDSNNNTVSGNIIKHDQEGGFGIKFSSSSYNNIVSNQITTCIFGVGIHLTDSFFNRIHRNNFFHIHKKARIVNCHNDWDGNYWNRPRFLPKLIFGIMLIGNIWVDVDWHPAQEPYDIS